MRYVCGFAFADVDQDRYVLLIEKLRPPWQKGYLNGLGGKIEGVETPEEAMAREFHEECGVHTHADEWLQFHYTRFGNGAEVHFLVTRMPRPLLFSARSLEEEVVQAFSVKAALEPGKLKLLYNIPYLLLMAQCYLDNPNNRYLIG